MNEINPTAQKYIDHIAEVCARRKPLVVCTTITYNHEKYLREALDGIVMQQTDFPFVAIVHDDASTDGTADILREYAEKYPDIILPIYETENQYSKRDGSIGRIIRAARAATGAKYIAMCEGDDYWIDPQKLQKQVSFLESHPDYSMCFGNAKNKWEDEPGSNEYFSDIESRDYEGYEFVDNWIVPTASVLYRQAVNDQDAQTYERLRKSGKLVATDILCFLRCATVGKCRGFKDTFSVYRRSDSGATNSFVVKNRARFMTHEIAMGNTFGGKVKKSYKKKVAIKVIENLNDYRKGQVKSIKPALRGFWFAPIDTLKLIKQYSGL